MLRILQESGRQARWRLVAGVARSFSSSTPRAPKRLRPRTVSAQIPFGHDKQYDSLVPAIYPSSTFLRGHDGKNVSGKCYSRDDNPTVLAAEGTIRELEFGTDALLFSSGMSAATAIFKTLYPGDQVIIPRVMYWALRSWIFEFAKKWKINVIALDFGEPLNEEDLMKALSKRPKFIWLETPANPTWSISDISKISKMAHDAGAFCVVDSTVATPVLTQPLELGADVVMHSATKYLNGHSDVLAGVLVANRKMAGSGLWQNIRKIRRNEGCCLSSFDAWLLQRGLRTVHLRVRTQSKQAMEIAKQFSQLDGVQVLYPGLPSFPGHELAKRQMKYGYGGMLSLRFQGGKEQALAFLNACKVFKNATSLGGVESLIEHRASVEGPSSPVPDDLLRLSIGIEDREDLLGDLMHAYLVAVKRQS